MTRSNGSKNVYYFIDFSAEFVEYTYLGLTEYLQCTYQEILFTWNFPRELSNTTYQTLP